MNETILRKFKWFLPWQDGECEDWLEEMSRQGLHLKEAGSFGRHMFTKGSAGEYSYRLDYNQGKPPEDYIQLIRDAGWEHLGKRSGWHYWRKAYVNGQAPELFTDRESKLRKYERLLKAYVASAPGAVTIYIIGIAQFKRFPFRHPSWFIALFIAFFVTWISVAVINAIMIRRRMEEIKRS